MSVTFQFLCEAKVRQKSVFGDPNFLLFKIFANHKCVKHDERAATIQHEEELAIRSSRPLSLVIPTYLV